MLSTPQLPRPRGPISSVVIDALGLPEHAIAPTVEIPRSPDPLGDEDLQLALYVLYELHYRGFAGVDDGWEWNASLLGLRRALEGEFERGLTQLIGAPAAVDVAPERMDVALRELADADDAPSVGRHIECLADVEQWREALIHRSAYQLKEGDPHCWAIPRLWGAPKAALTEILADEYGGGRAARIHAQLFADVMAAAGLDCAYGAYLDRIPGVTLATVNLMSWLGLHRRFRAAIVGHFAIAELTSSVPMTRWANGVRRLGYGDQAMATTFYDEHVVADSVHDNIATIDLAGGLVRQDPGLAGAVLWGARAFLAVEGVWSCHVLDAWRGGHSSLLAEPVAAAAST
jgi:Iron-containing redox enzyme